MQDFGFTGNDEPEEPQAEIDLMPEDDAQPRRGGGASSANAYRDINRQLSTFYETPAVDEEKRGFETAGGGTDRPTATAAERHAYR